MGVKINFFFTNLSELTIALLASLLPISLMILWQVNNFGLPLADANDFISASAKIANSFRDGGILEGIKNLYLERPWRPVSFHLILLPFMLVSNNNIFFTSACVHVVCLVLITIYSYHIFRIKSDKKTSFLGAITISLLSNSFFPGGYVLFSETLLTPALLGFIYHLFVSDYMKDKRHAYLAAIFLALSVTLRPIEAIIHTAPVIILFLYCGYKNTIFSLKLITKILTIFLIGISFLAISGFSFAVSDLITNLEPPFSERLYRHASTTVFILTLALILPPILIWIKDTYNSILTSPTNNNTYILPAFSLFTIATVLWWVGSWKELIRWIYVTNYGIVAQASTDNTGADLPKSLSELWSRISFHLEYGGFLVAIVFALALIYFASSYFKRTWRINGEILYTSLFCGTLLPILTTFLTAQNSHRKIANAYVILVVLGILISISYKNFNKLTRIILITLITIQSWSIFQITNKITPSKITKFVTGSAVSMPEKRSVETEVTNFLNQQQAIIGQKMNIIFPPNTEVDVFTIMTLISISTNHKNYSIHCPVTHYEKTLADSLLSSKEFNAVFLVNPDGKMKESPEYKKLYGQKINEKFSHYTINNDLLYSFFSGKFEEYGYEKVACLNPSKDKEAAEGCLFINKNNIKNAQ